MQGNLQRPLHSCCFPHLAVLLEWSHGRPSCEPIHLLISRGKDLISQILQHQCSASCYLTSKAFISFHQKPHPWRLPHDQDRGCQTAVWYSYAHLRKASSQVKCYAKMQVWIEEPKSYYLEKRKAEPEPKLKTNTKTVRV